MSQNRLNCAIGLLLWLSAASQAAEPAQWDAAALLPLANAQGGTLSLVAPPVERLQVDCGKILLFKAEGTAAVLSFRLPVPEDGEYRVRTELVFGPWRDGRYGMYYLEADGTRLDRWYHGWYGRAPSPVYRLQGRDWGVVSLRKPTVELSFRHEPDQRGNLLGVALVRLERVEGAPRSEAQEAAPRSSSKPHVDLTVPVEDPARLEEARRSPAEDPQNAIPQLPVTRATYLAWCERSGHPQRDLVNRRHGPYGPRHALPSLARCVAGGERRYGESVREMLRDFARWLEAEVAEKGLNSQYMHEPTLIGMELLHLRRGGLIGPEDEPWVREMILRLNRTVHVWGAPESFYRGPMHRSQGEGVMKWLAAQWYPDAPEAPAWRQYAQTVWNDFWAYRDNPPNDTGYYFGILYPIVLGVELMDRTPSGQTPAEFFNDPGMRKIWDRLAMTVSPDGAVIPYGAHGGWDSTAAERIWILELAARHTRDGRYRFVAHRMMNYLLYQEDRLRTHHILDGPYSTEPLALAYLLADDSLPPAEPGPESCVLSHKETLRVNGKQGAAAYLKNLDPAPDKAHVCCGLIVTDAELPFKLVFRSGWQPGDLFMLVDLFARHEPMNPSGVLGLTRFGTPFTQAVTSKEVTDFHNMLMVEDLSGTAAVVSNPNPHTIDAYYQQVSVDAFSDHRLATCAAVRVDDLTGFPMTNTRQFVFVKNRFVVVKDVARFRDRFLAGVGPVWRTQRISARGEHWANTYLAAPLAAERTALRQRPFDLLVYHAPRPDCRLEIVQTASADKPYACAPLRTRYVRQGLVDPDTPVAFTQLLLPHSPLAPAEQLAAGIQVLVDQPEQTVIRLSVEPDREEWIVVNPAGAPLKAGALETDARSAYLDLREGKVARTLVVGGTCLSHCGHDVHRQSTRGDWEKP